MAYLAITSREEPPRFVELSDGLCAGRGPQCGLVLPDVQVSRQHLRFSHEGGAWAVADLGSTHGVLVNEQRITRHTLADGDQIQAGHTVLVFHEEGTPAEVLHEALTADDDGAPSGADARLHIFYDLARAVDELGDTGALLDRLLDGIIDVLGAERGAVALCGPGALHTVARARRGPVPALVIAREVQAATLSRKSAVIVQEPAGSDTMVRQHVRSAMAAPLLWKSRVLGLLYVDDLAKTGRFSEADLAFLSALGRVCAAAIEGAEQLQSAVAAADAARREPRALLGESSAIRTLRDRLRKVAAADAHVVIHGETGTGKELVANEIHALSPRAVRPFVAVNCAALPEGLVESELFGHRKGAFTGATEDRTGMFARAHRGTLFLDEIAELPLPAQAKVLRAIQEGEVLPLGASRPALVDVRVVAASHRDLMREVKAGRFREDLYYRLHVVEVTVPPLRERGDDIALLARAFLVREAARSPRRLVGFSEEALDALLAHPWPGNVRELRNEVERAVILAEGAFVELRDLSSRVRGAAAAIGESGDDGPFEEVSFELDLQVAPRGRRSNPQDAAPPDEDVASPPDAAEAASEAASLPPGVSLPPYSEAKRAAIHTFDQHYFRELYALTRGNVSAMARASGLERHHVRAHLRRLGLQGTGEG